MKKLLPALLKLAVSAGLLIFIFKGQNLSGEIWPRLRLMLVNWHWTLAGLGCVAASYICHAWRWQALLKGQNEPSPLPLLTKVTLCAGFFSLSPLGATGGDAYRVLALLAHGGFRRLPVVVSVLLDHLVGLASLALLYVTFVTAFTGHWASHSPAVRHLVSGFTIFMAGALIFMILSVWSFSPRLYAWGEKRMPRFLGHPKIKSFCQACDALRQSWLRSLEALLASLVMFVAHFLIFYCSARAINEAPPLSHVMAAMPIVDTLSGLPISFAGLGVREKTFETLMASLSGMNESAAISASLAGWLFQVFWAMIGGIIFLLSRSRKSSANDHA